jgi:acetylornithine deacetylase/succinyl-diaminopimelate desuccinylase-like protein
MLPVVSMATISLRDEATELLQEVLRVNTVNPPGNETAAAEVIRAYLEEHGVECDLLAKVPERANLVARLPGRGDGPRLLLLGHTDTVVADAAEWTLDPWSGDLRDGEVWGRGALDMKSQTVASAVALAVLAREGFEPAGDLIYAAVADEEVGVDFGLSWLCREHPDAVRAEYCINEGGGDRIVANGRVFYACSTAEKMSAPFAIRVHGTAGHASMPRVADNALAKIPPLLERLAAFDPEPRLIPETSAFLEAVLGEVPPAAEVIPRLGEVDPALAAMVEPTLALTIAPTMISASRARNVIPSVCELVCDCRILPDEGTVEAERTVRSWLGDLDGYELEWIEAVGGTRSSMHTPLWEAVSSFVAEAEPGATAVPVVLSGFTDSHYMREAFGTVAYGFFPMRTMGPDVSAKLIHSADERIPVDDLELGVRFLRHVAQRLLGP